MQDKVAGLRRFGSAALDLAFVAAGRIDGYWERNLSPWDMAAGIVIVREAGGFVTDLEGRDGMFATHHIVAGNETIQRALLAALKTAATRTDDSLPRGLVLAKSWSDGDERG